MSDPRLSPASFIAVTAAGIYLLSPMVRAEVPDAEATKLTGKYGCQACHSLNTKLVGPSFQDVAKKYSGDKLASETLTHKIKTGGSGVWGPIPMPPASSASDVDVALLVEWILSQK